MSPGTLGGGHQQVEAAHASSGTQPGTAQQQPSGRAKLVTANTSGDLGASSRTWLLIVLVAFAVALAAAAAAGVRRFATASRTPAAGAAPILVMPPAPRPPAEPMRPAQPQAQTPPPPAPPPEPAEEPPPADQLTQVRPQPAPPAAAAPQQPQHRARTATMIASGIATVALRELMKRRKRH